MLQRPYNRRAELRRLRDRRLRARRKAGKVVVPVELGGDELGFLIQTRWLAERDAGDARAIGEAIGRMLADSATR
jgi:hypothetical protein